VDWDQIAFYEHEDTTSGSRELACTSGACEVVDNT
jgi:ribonucleoside-triphosphate reductase (thioredoxin)